MPKDDDDHEPIPPIPHVQPGTDFETYMRVKMDYTVRELSRQGKLLGNGVGLIADVREMKAWKSNVVKVLWIVATALIVTFAVWFAVAMVKLSQKG